MTETEQKQIFETWLAQHKAVLFKIIRAYAFTAMDRDDLFQEITIQVWHSIPAFRREAAVTTWLYRIALNTAMKWIRKERRHDHAEDLDHAQHIIQENNVPADERLTWLYEEIHKLDAVDRSIALLLLDGFSYREMAIVLGITESNVGVKINRIKKHLITQSQKHARHGI